MKDEIQSRRLVLHGALAVGCSLCLPIVLTGCDSKKGAIPASEPYGAPAASAEAAAPAAAAKMSQVSVQYQAQPKGDLKCGDCTNFIAGSNTCKRVDGQISAEGWCAMWAKKT